MSGRVLRYADGNVDDVASILCAAHVRAEQYLEQAPALAVLACQKFGTNITYGEVDRFTASISADPKLRDLLKSYGVSAPMRKIVPAALRIKDGPILRELARLDPSSLSQSIPSDSQRVWLDGIRKWMALAPTGKKAYAGFSVAWIARQLGENLSRFEQVGALIDFVRRGGGEINPRWSWDRAIEATQQWHHRLRDEAALRRLAAVAREAATFDTIICKSALPDEAELDGYRFRVLRTLRALREEGEAMHHCVASYAGDVRRGRCAIVSVARDGVGVGTLEINAKGVVSQLKAHCNAAVTPATRAACENYALQYWRAPEKKGRK